MLSQFKPSTFPSLQPKIFNVALIGNNAQAEKRDLMNKLTRTEHHDLIEHSILPIRTLHLENIDIRVHDIRELEPGNQIPLETIKPSLVIIVINPKHEASFTNIQRTYNTALAAVEGNKNKICLAIYHLPVYGNNKTRVTPEQIYKFKAEQGINIHFDLSSSGISRSSIDNISRYLIDMAQRYKTTATPHNIHHSLSPIRR